MVQSIKFSIFQISWPKEERRNASLLYNPATIKEMQVKYPYLPWLEYINAMLPDNVQVDENEVVIVSVPSFFEKLGDVIHSVPKRTLANYFGWRIVLATSGTLTDELRRRKILYFSSINGQREEEPRWKECASYTSSKY